MVIKGHIKPVWLIDVLIKCNCFILRLQSRSVATEEYVVSGFGYTLLNRIDSLLDLVSALDSLPMKNNFQSYFVKNWHSKHSYIKKKGNLTHSESSAWNTFYWFSATNEGVLNFSHLREGVTLGVVPLLPNVDDKVDQANLPQSCFFSFHFLFLFRFLLLKETETKAFWSGYSLYIQHCSLFEETPSENTCRREWKDRGWKERTPGELYITGSGGIQTNQKGRRGLLLWSWQLCSLKWVMVLQPDGVRLDTGDTCKLAGVHIYV